jgi:hypothetical protein
MQNIDITEHRERNQCLPKASESSKDTKKFSDTVGKESERLKEVPRDG